MMLISNFNNCVKTRDDIRDHILSYVDSNVSETDAVGSDVGFEECLRQNFLKRCVPIGFGPDWQPEYTEQTTYREIIDDIWNELQKFNAKLEYLRNETNNVKALVEFFKWQKFPTVDVLGKVISGRECWDRRELNRKMLAKILQQDIQTFDEIRTIAYEWFMTIHGMDLEWVTGQLDESSDDEDLKLKQMMQSSAREKEDQAAAIGMVNDLDGLAELVGKIRHKATDPENIRLV